MRGSGKEGEGVGEKERRRGRGREMKGMGTATEGAERETIYCGFGQEQCRKGPRNRGPVKVRRVRAGGRKEEETGRSREGVVGEGNGGPHKELALRGLALHKRARLQRKPAV